MPDFVKRGIVSVLIKEIINISMKNCSPEKLAIIATQIAIEISKGKDIDELNLIKCLIGQVSSVISTIILQRINNKID